MSYIDACIMVMLARKDDSLRKVFGIGKKDADYILRKQRFSIPMAALGEAVHQIRQKSRNDYKEPLDDLNRLLDKGRIKAEYIKSREVFAIAKEISSEKEDVRDQISPMDALILSSAAVDDSCSRFYTTDSRLISNSEVSDIIREWRDNMGYRPMTIMDVSDIFRRRASRISSFGNLGNRKASREPRRRGWRQPAHLQRCEGCLVNGFSDSAPASEH